MAHYENEALGVSFDVADRITVREQLAFRQAIFNKNAESTYERYWAGAVKVLKEWQCELVPDPTALDLDEADDARIADIVQWTANIVAGHMAELRTPPKK